MTIGPLWLAKIQEIVGDEGGYDSITDDPNDKGGFTRAGITASTFAEITKCTLDEAHRYLKDIINVDGINEFYYNKFVRAPHFDQLKNKQLGFIVADIGVLIGPTEAIKELQVIWNKLYPRTYWLTVDGILGPLSLSQLNHRELDMLDNKQIKESFVKENITKFIRICQKNPSQIEYLLGWFNRAWENLDD